MNLDREALDHRNLVLEPLWLALSAVCRANADLRCPPSSIGKGKSPAGDGWGGGMFGGVPQGGRVATEKTVARPE